MSCLCLAGLPTGVSGLRSPCRHHSCIPCWSIRSFINGHLLTCYLYLQHGLLLTGIHPSLQCILCGTSTLSGRSFVSRISIQPCSVPSLSQTIHGRRSRRTPSSSTGAYVWEGPCTVRTGFVLFETVQEGSRGVRGCIKV